MAEKYASERKAQINELIRPLFRNQSPYGNREYPSPRNFEGKPPVPPNQQLA